jgi:glycerol-3-phosphate dehydrogenase
MQEFDTAIIGGGIVGAGIFRDLAQHGMSTVLIDKKDFCSETSQKSSKMLHGGIRYLENLDFHLVFEALHEKNLWLKIAPHLCYEEEFYLPIFDDSKRPLWMMSIGLFLYDLLSSFQNSPFKIKRKISTLSSIPILKSDKLVGSGIYCDAIVDDSKMGLETIYDALKFKNTKALNYHEYISHESKAGHHKLKLKNHFSKEIIEIKCKHLIFALGPFTDKILTEQKILLPSKGSHLWFNKKDFPLEHPIVMTTKDDRVIFVIPQNGMVLVGTTEIPTSQEDLNNPVISEAEIEYLLKNLNFYFPEIYLNKSHIIGSFSGIRPLVKENDGNSLGKTSREHKVIMPTSNTFVIAGGKYTTFRVMGQEISKIIVERKGKSYNPDCSKLALTQKSIIPAFHFRVPNEIELENILKCECPKTLNDLVIRRFGISNRKIWELKTKVDFNEYFLKHMNLLNQYLVINENDIIKF